MAILKAVNPKKAKARLISNIVCYVLQDKKTEKILTYGKDIDVAACARQMNETKKFWGKTGGREYYHFVQSFPPNEKITPEKALELAKEFLEKTRNFDGYEVLLATHKDKKHIHTHFIVNSVSLKDGKKFQYTRKDLESWKNLQDKINQKHGFQKAVEKGFTQDGERRSETVANNRATFELLKKAELQKGIKSYVMNCALAVCKNSKKAKSKEEFCELMKNDGFKTKWEESRKNVVFTDIKREEQGEARKSVRLSKLFDYYNIEQFNKEKLLDEFTRNSERTREFEPAGRNSEITEKLGKFDKFKQRSKQFDNFQRAADAAERAELARKSELEQQRRIAEKQRNKYLQQSELDNQLSSQRTEHYIGQHKKRNQKSNDEYHGLGM